MAYLALADELDDAIQMMIDKPGYKLGEDTDTKVRELLEIADELRKLPNPAFRAQLKADLLEEAFIHSDSVTHARRSARVLEIPRTHETKTIRPDILPSLFGGSSSYPMQRSNFAISFFGQTIAVALLVTTGLVFAHRPQPMKEHVSVVLYSPDSLPLPVALSKSSGGGGGGDHDKFEASKGSAPRFADEQITPPTVVIQNEKPILTAEPTLVGPSQITLPQLAQMGDPLSKTVGPPSNGTGKDAGIGNGSGGGVGIGNGPGFGAGEGGGIGGGIYRAGFGGVSAPRAIYDPEPEYSEEARKAKCQGNVILYVIIGPDGQARDLRVQRSLGLGLDEKAIDAVKKWRFEPAMKDGHPVSVAVNIEVSFRLY